MSDWQKAMLAMLFLVVCVTAAAYVLMDHEYELRVKAYQVKCQQEGKK